MNQYPKRPPAPRLIPPFEGGARAVTWSGEVRINNAAELHAELVRAVDGSVDVTVCLAAVPQADTAALQLLAAARAALARLGRRLRLTGIVGPLRETFLLAGLGELLSDTAA